MAHVLLVDDETSVVTVLGKLLRSRGHTVQDTTDLVQAKTWAARPDLEVVLMDVGMGEADGIEMMAEFHQVRPDLPILIMSGDPSVETAVRAARGGAFDFLVKPLKLDMLDRAIRDAISQASDPREASVPMDPRELPRRHGLVGSAPAFLHAMDQAERLALADVPVLIRSEPGSGAGAMAEVIHRLSRAADRTFAVAHTEHADEVEMERLLFAPRTGWLAGNSPGTLYLAGIQGLSPTLQERVRQAIAQEGDLYSVRTQTPVRIVASIRLTGEGDAERIANSQLMNVLGAFAFDVPPLRARAQDVVPLFVEALTRRESSPQPVVVEPAARHMLDRYFWPGNLSELVEVAQAVPMPAHRTLAADHLRDLLPDPEPSSLDLASKGLRSASGHGVSLAGYLRQKEVQHLDHFLQIPYDSGSDLDRRIREILVHLRDQIAVA